jgi:hypothetical protein
VNGEWQKYSTQNIIDTGNKVSLSLLKLGVKPDDKVAIVSNNRPEWNMVDTGILQIGAVNVPVYPTISEHEYKFIFNDAGIEYAFVSDKNLFNKISSIKSEVPTLKEIFSFEKVDGCKHFSDFLTLILGFFFLLALGPFLHIGGQTITIAGWSLPLPYLLFYYTVPFIGLTRSLSRYDLMVMLALGVLAALALAKLQLPNYAIRPTQYALRTTWLPLLATLLICFEFLPLPYPISKIETPPFYFDLAADPETYTVAELPMNWDRPTPLLQQTVHHKRLLTAYTSRDNPLELAWRTPVLQQWRYLAADIIDQPLADIAPTIFFDFNLRYIILDYWQMPPGPEREGTEKWVTAALPLATPVYEDGRLKVYQAPPKIETQPYLSLGEGWSDRHETETGLTRTFTGPGAEIFLHHPQNQALTLEISAASSHERQLVTLWADETLLTTFEVTPTLSQHALVLPALGAELVKLKFVPSSEVDTIVVKRLGLSQTNEN